MPWPYPRVFAHRGGGTLAPENTLAAIRFGAELGFRGVEFDVMLAGDDVPVLIHDETLQRTTGQPGRVPDTASVALARLDAGAWRGRRWRGEGIPSFADAAQLCHTLKLCANVEIKPAIGVERETGAAVATMARQLWPVTQPPPLLSSFSVEALAAAREAAPELPRGYLIESIPVRWRETTAALDCVAIHCNHRVLTRRLVSEMHAAGYAVLAWTVNHRITARKLFSWGVDCVVTDALDRITADLARQADSAPSKA